MSICNNSLAGHEDDVVEVELGGDSQSIKYAMSPLKISRRAFTVNWSPRDIRVFAVVGAK